MKEFIKEAMIQTAPKSRFLARVRNYKPIIGLSLEHIR